MLRCAIYLCTDKYWQRTGREASFVVLLINLVAVVVGWRGRTGQKYYGKRSMHDVTGPDPNPYQVGNFSVVPWRHIVKRTYLIWIIPVRDTRRRNMTGNSRMSLLSAP